MAFTNNRQANESPNDDPYDLNDDLDDPRDDLDDPWAGVLDSRCCAVLPEALSRVEPD